MKHPLSTTALLVFLFVCAQLAGIALLSLNIDEVSTDDAGVRTVTHDSTVIGDRPQTSGGGSLLYIVIGVAVGTALMLLIIRFKLFTFWKAWFLLAVWLSTAIALGVVLPAAVALVLCFFIAAWKVYRPNPFIHNVTEIFMYAGIAILIAPLFSLWWAIALLGIISVYDMIAVWQSKHMVVMAEAQRENKLFAGLFIPGGEADKSPLPAPDVPPRNAAPITKTTITKTIKVETAKVSGVAGKRHGKGATKTIVMDEPPAPPAVAKGTRAGAILGGGDIAFPLIFSGVVMDWAIAQGASQTLALYQTLAVTVGATAALTLLFVFAKKDRYYPAMPFISAGCIAGLAIVWLLQML